MIFIAAEVAAEQTPLEATALYQVVTVGLTINDTGLVAPLISAKSVAVADVVEDCHWIAPTEPVAKVRVLVSPLQIAPAPEIVFTTETGFTVIVIASEVEAGQAPLDTTTL